MSDLFLEICESLLGMDVDAAIRLLVNMDGCRVFTTVYKPVTKRVDASPIGEGETSQIHRVVRVYASCAREVSLVICPEIPSVPKYFL